MRANLRTQRIKNGDIAEVAGFEQDGSILLDDGRVLPPTFCQFTHGYATTSHASQGKTVDCGILIMSDAGIRAGNLKQAYVSNSRFRESQTIYTTDRDEARDAMATDADRQLAVELTGEAVSDEDEEIPPWENIRRYEEHLTEVERANEHINRGLSMSAKNDAT